MQQDFVLESNSKKVLLGLLTQRKSGKYCDVKIRVGGSILWSHGCVLSMFASGLGEGTPEDLTHLHGNWSVRNPLEITLNELKGSELTETYDCLDCVDKVLDFLYHGRISINCKHDHVRHLESLSKIFHLPELLDMCQQLQKKSFIKDSSRKRQTPCREEGFPCSENLEPSSDTVPAGSHQNKHASGRSTYGCLSCGATHRTATLLLKHLQDVHENHGLTCSLCLKYTAPDAETFMTHLQHHDHELPFFCLACDARFRTRTALASHEPRHSTETPFLCAQCGRGFKWKHALSSHSLVHSAEKRHLCDTCGFSTAHISTFRTHKMVHAGACFRCPQPNCKFVASRKQSLAHHIATHTKERHYQCEVCGQSFSMYKNLRRHAARHEPSPAGLVCCPVPGCLYANTRLDKIKAHAERHRSGKPVRTLLVPRARKAKNLPASNTSAPPIVTNSVLLKIPAVEQIQQTETIINPEHAIVLNDIPLNNAPNLVFGEEKISIIILPPDASLLTIQ